MNARYLRILIPTLAMAVVVAACSASSEGDEALFWPILQFRASDVEQYGSVAEMAASADVVVLGSIDSVGIGRVWGSEDPTDRLASLVLRIRVDEVLRGSLIVGASDFVSVERSTFALPAEAFLESLTDGVRLPDGSIAAIPSGQAIWFLRLRNDLGSELLSSEVQYDGGEPYRVVNSQGVITELADGNMATPLAVLRPPEDGEIPDLPEQRFTDEIRGIRFADLVNQVREP